MQKAGVSLHSACRVCSADRCCKLSSFVVVFGIVMVTNRGATKCPKYQTPQAAEGARTSPWEGTAVCGGLNVRIQSKTIGTLPRWFPSPVRGRSKNYHRRSHLQRQCLSKALPLHLAKSPKACSPCLKPCEAQGFGSLMTNSFRSVNLRAYLYNLYFPIYPL